MSSAMRDETSEQPAAIEAALRGRSLVASGEVRLDVAPVVLSQVERVVLTGCGSSLHAAMLGAREVESVARVAAHGEVASELAARAPALDARTLVVLVSQSGETDHTLAALRRARSAGARTLAVVNGANGTIARESDAALDVRAGPERAIPSTKAFSASVAVLSLLAIALGRARGVLDVEATGALLASLDAAPALVRAALALESAVVAWASSRASINGMLLLGARGLWPVALEGALKIQETSYVPAVAAALGELAHGRIALVGPRFPVVVLAPSAAAVEARAALARLVAVGADLAAIVDERVELPPDVTAFRVPAASDSTSVFAATVVVQLLARALAEARQLDPDRPRHLAKTVASR